MLLGVGGAGVGGVVGLLLLEDPPPQAIIAASSAPVRMSAPNLKFFLLDRRPKPGNTNNPGMKSHSA
jgi:hypothetical protein